MCLSVDTMACLAVQAQQLQAETATQILSEDVAAEEIRRLWQVLAAYESRLTPQDANHYVPYF